MATYQINPANVQAVAQDIRSSAEQIRGQLTDMDSKLAQYLDEWTGLDRDIYGDYKLKWNGIIDEMNRILTTNAAPALDTMVQNILDTIKKNGSLWS